MLVLHIIQRVVDYRGSNPTVNTIFFYLFTEVIFITNT